MRPEDTILFYRYDNHETIEDFLYHLDRKDLRVGKVIGNKIRGRTTRRYEIRHIEDGYITKVALKPVTITMVDIILLVIIASLAFVVFNALSPLLIPAP
ncbi:hypothetical protein [Megalodesulfovibrio gigas]|uniref:Uncharacterized protein n=1 Tax=Megalodesulfovibrio gigas (strain ATCC 19364 / DSM 1382 / NCIMB 9332 / VKM B-1759) TaxID=1121448 RepID=T2GC05_MEGG1|nr:hypothetical protein [Megalodesulfovibrio gigas]AGW13704.1 hypothetical protein DGI_1924 [Megalodesulfovibrio gigas DSM 1382 = ATCC 19364]